VTGFPARKDVKVGKNGGKVREIMVDTMKELMKGNDMKKSLGSFAEESGSGGVLSKFQDKVGAWISLFTSTPLLCTSILDDPQIQKIIQGGMQYDLAFNNALVNECTLPIASKVARHLILLTPGTVLFPLSYDLNIPHPLSTIPSIALKVMPPMSFIDRLSSSAVNFFMLIMQNYVQYPLVNGIVQEKLPGYPLVEDVKRNASLLFTNRLSAIDGAMPSMPTMVEIGGMIGRPAKPLPKDIEDFVQGAGKEGFIYMALGSVVPEELITESRKRIIIEAFSRLPQRVIWKFKEQRSDIPANVKTVTWAPQQDILGHPKLRAFISHGGHSSLDESLYHGVPILGMPIFGDQPANVFRAEALGFGLGLEWEDITLEIFAEKLNQIINNKRYKDSALHHSTLIRDQQVSGLDRAFYWTEYVIRHDGALHLRSAADHLNFFQYFLLDIAAAVVAIATLVLYVIYKLVRLTCCRSKSKQKKTKTN
jgi:glucuronosyltransferase